MRRLMLILGLILCISTSQAQEATWQAWLFDATTGEAALIESNGVLLKQFALPVPDYYADYEILPEISVSPDGTRLAYGLRGTTTRNADDNRALTFVVYDAEGERILFQYETPAYGLAASLDFSDVAWNSTGNVVAFAYVDTNGDWRIVAFNAINGISLSDLGSFAPYFENEPAAQEANLLPVIQYYDEANIAFNLVPYQAYDFSLELVNFEWDIVTGRVSKTNRAPRLTGDTLQATGETISPIVDERVNFDALNAPYTNAVQVYRPEVGGRLPFFATATNDILEAEFVENGAKVLVLVEDLISFERRYLLVNRAGVARGLPQLNVLEGRIASIERGFIYMVNSETPFLLELNTLDESFPQGAIWQAPAGSHFVPIWASSSPVETYEGWAQLAPPIYLSNIVVVPVTDLGLEAASVPTLTPMGREGGVITVNTVAVINTTSGDRLNMRDTPSLTGNVIARVDAGTRVVVIGGSVSADGFIWWEIRLPTAQTGWVVERAEGVQTLVPAN